MIFGSPDKFAIYYDIVEDWSKNGFHEGFISIFIDKKLAPSNFYDYVSTLDINMEELKESNLISPKKNDELFKKKKLDLCCHLLKKRYPASSFYSKEEYENYPDHLYEDEDFSYFIELDFLSRSRFSAFVLSSDNISRILIVKLFRNEGFINLSSLRNKDIYDTHIETKELVDIIKESINYYEKNIIRFIDE